MGLGEYLRDINRIGGDLFIDCMYRIEINLLNISILSPCLSVCFHSNKISFISNLRYFVVTFCVCVRPTNMKSRVCRQGERNVTDVAWKSITVFTVVMLGKRKVYKPQTYDNLY